LLSAHPYANTAIGGTFFCRLLIVNMSTVSFLVQIKISLGEMSRKLPSVFLKNVGSFPNAFEKNNKMFTRSGLFIFKR